jgi:hypothetical protein
VASVEQRRKELLDNTLPKPVRPAFTFIPAAQTLEGKRVDIIQVKLADSDAELAKRLKLLFGPDWDKLRVVAHEKQIVALLGSDEKLLQAALVNVKENRPGLAKAKSQQAFTRLTEAGRKTELHLSLHTARGLIEAEDLKQPVKNPAQPALTSFGVFVDNESLQADIWLPVPELKVILERVK